MPDIIALPRPANRSAVLPAITVPLLPIPSVLATGRVLSPAIIVPRVQPAPLKIFVRLTIIVPLFQAVRLLVPRIPEQTV